MNDLRVTSSAPGRVNLIGEHTDYNAGFVLPCAIPQRTHVELTRSAGNTVRVWSDGVGEGAYELGKEARTHGWLDYVQGVTHVLRSDGHTLSGCELRIHSNVPLGSGLSSSAALEIALLRALRTAFSLPLDDVQLALLGRRVENEFVGAPVGVMDQMASSLADERSALFLDTRSLEYQRVPLPRGIELVVINSGVAHNHAHGDYKTRKSECDRAAALLHVKALRDIDDVRQLECLPDVLKKRARHVVSENARVLAAVDAMRAHDLPELGRLFDESHVSMRDDFEVSVPEVDLLVAIARRASHVHGARLTGGGFGGSIVALVDEGHGREAARAIVDAYIRQSGRAGAVLVPA